MNYSKITFKLASWCFMITGIGHTATHFTLPENPEALAVIETMKNFSVNLMGKQVDIFSFHVGFSLTMGLLLFSYGLLNILLLKSFNQQPIASSILIVNIVVSAIATFLSVKYFFIVPVTLLAIATISYTIALIKRT